MGAALRLVDERPDGTVVRKTVLELASETVTARELLERRVRAEVARFNAQAGETLFQGLVERAERRIRELEEKLGGRG